MARFGRRQPSFPHTGKPVSGLFVLSDPPIPQAGAGNTLSGGPTLQTVTVAGTVVETFVLSGGTTLANVVVAGTLTSNSPAPVGQTVAMLFAVTRSYTY